MYPEFGVLGIQEGSSPALVREVGRQVALLPSYAICREELARRGLDLDIKELYGIGKYAGAAALTYRQRFWSTIVRVSCPLARNGRASVWACS